jgi:transposase
MELDVTLALSIFGSPERCYSGSCSTAFSVPIESEGRLQFLALTRFLHANRTSLENALSGRLRDLAPSFPAEIRRQDAEGRGCHAVEAPRLTDRQRPSGVQLSTHLVG